jgi:hypothetical protein
MCCCDPCVSQVGHHHWQVGLLSPMPCRLLQLPNPWQAGVCGMPTVPHHPATQVWRHHSMCLRSRLRKLRWRRYLPTVQVPFLPGNPQWVWGARYQCYHSKPLPSLPVLQWHHRFPAHSSHRKHQQGLLGRHRPAIRLLLRRTDHSPGCTHIIHQPCHNPSLWTSQLQSHVCLQRWHC